MLADRSKYIELLRRCRVLVSAGAECEVTMRTIQGPRIFQLLVRAHRAQTSDGESQREFFTSLVDVTDQRALAQERARVADEYAALATRFIEVQDAERQRIARNLHDDIGQQHTAIWLKLELLLRQTTEEPVKRLIEEIRHMFARLDQRVHFVATELRPSSLDLGLVRALEQFVHEWSATFRVPVSFLSHLPTHVRFAVEVETQLYRIAQEALNNVAKHASARNVSVVIDVREHEVVLVVEDDGRGFDSRNAAIARQSFGLVGMRERAQLVGGRLSVESAPGHGTSIFVHVPNPAMPGSQSERGSR
jgi:signal transduction histidine kinase